MNRREVRAVNGHFGGMDEKFVQVKGSSGGWKRSSVRVAQAQDADHVLVGL